jgi:hypothetical protein
MTNYYYGYTGSEGTYTATASSTALGHVIISAITANNFVWNVGKNTGNNVSVYITFLICYNLANTDYPKVYS